MMWYLLAYTEDTRESSRLWLSIPLPAFRKPGSRLSSFVFVGLRSLDADERSDFHSPELFRRFDERYFADHLLAVFPRINIE